MRLAGWLILSASILGLYKVLAPKEPQRFKLPNRIPPDMTDRHKQLLEELPSGTYIIIGFEDSHGRLSFGSALLSRSRMVH